MIFYIYHPETAGTYNGYALVAGISHDLIYAMNGKRYVGKIWDIIGLGKDKTLVKQGDLLIINNGRLYILSSCRQLVFMGKDD